MKRNKKISIYIFIPILIIIALVLVLIKQYNPETGSFFIPCILYELTGIKCPGCGMTRAIHNLLNFNISTAIWYNLMLIPSILLVVYIIYKYIKFLVKNEKVFDKKLELILKAFAIMLLIFGVTRNFATLFY